MYETPGVLIASAEEVMIMEDQELDREYSREVFYSSIASHVQQVFQDNKDARTTSEVERKMLESLRAYNGHYDPEDRAKIKESGGSDIYMNLTPTKCRAAMSWIRDILMPAKEQAWSLSPTPIPDVPEEVRLKIEQAMGEIAKLPQPTQMMQATQSLQETTKMKQDLEVAIMDQIYKEAERGIKKYERRVADRLAEGGWDKALSDFIEDFCVFQVAVMKGPIITKKKRLQWVDGKPEAVEDYIYMNKRVSPLDIYPSASATSIQDGDLCEHLRFSRQELYNLIGVEGYKEDNIRKILEENATGTGSGWLDTYIESEKVIEEYRGDEYRANKGIIHGIHFFGSASYQMLQDWGYQEEDLGYDTEAEFEVEAILAGNEVIKCSINDDPLLRRPYYKASFQEIPGSWWGRSLPELMRDIQRMCNATARALANNMGIASGPQIEVYVDRLAADEEIDEIYPLKIWQLTSDPTGAGGRAVQFWQPTSNAQELLAVYKEFEVKADDATGIPRYAYGNEKSGGAAQTASGLSMLLEGASKGIKDAIKHIDLGLIIPRVEYQFYWEVMTDPTEEFTGDIVVVPKGSQALTMKGAIELRRNEFLNILANPVYFQIVGVEGVAEILREMAKSLGLGDDVVPSRIELKKQQQEAEAAQAQAQQAEAQQGQQQAAAGVQAVQLQTQSAERISQGNMQLKVAELQAKLEQAEKDFQLKVAELEEKGRSSQNKELVSIQKEQIKADQKDRDTNKNLATSISTGDKSNLQ